MRETCGICMNRQFCPGKGILDKACEDFCSAVDGSEIDRPEREEGEDDYENR